MSPLCTLGFAFVVVGACACKAPEPNTTLTSADVRSTSSAERVRLSLAAAQCDRSGPTCARYANRDACIAEEQRVLSRDIDLHYCARGIEAPDVDDCVEAIRSSPCTTRVRDITECKADSLCRPWDEARP